MYVCMYVCLYCLQYCKINGWATGRADISVQIQCWFVGGDDLTRALLVLDFWLSPLPPSSSCHVQQNPEWYQFTEGVLEYRLLRRMVVCERRHAIADLVMWGSDALCHGTYSQTELVILSDTNCTLYCTSLTFTQSYLTTLL